MRLGWRSTNDQSQIIVADDESTSSTPSLMGKERSSRKHRQSQKQQQQSPCEASSSSSSSSSCTVVSTSSNSSISNSSLSDDDDFSPMGVGDEENDDSSSSLPSQAQQQHSQAFLTAPTTSSLEDMVISTGICDIEGDPPYESSNINNSYGSNSGGKGRSDGRSNNKNKVSQRQHRRKNHRISSAGMVEDEDEDDEEGSENDVQTNNSNESQSQLQQQPPRRNQQQRTLGQTPNDSLLHEQPMSQQQHESHSNQSSQIQSDNINGSMYPLTHTTYGRHGGRTTVSKEHVDNDEYEEEKQRQQRTGKKPSKGSNNSNEAGSNNSNTKSNDGKITDDHGNVSDVEDDDEDDDDDDDDGSDHEVPIWKPQDTQSVCEFTHTIKDYSAKRDSGCKKAEYSTTTVDNLGNKWRLIVYVNGNGRASNNHLSLFLQVADADDLPFGWKKAVSYVLTLEHPQAGAGLSYAKRNPDKTFKLCPKAIDWGWSQFITSDRIQQESFVSNDTLVVRASVTVKSSSVDIDLDDAELYLKCAVEEGRPEAVQLCLAQGASVNCQFKDDLYTPLHTACSTSPNEDGGVNSPLGSGGGGEHTKQNVPQSNKSNNNNNTNPIATHEGSMKVLELLLEKGADGNACNKWRETPLLIAANNGHKAAVEALLKHGADPSLCSEAGWSALTFAAHKGYGDIVELLLDDGAPVNCRVTEDSSTPLHKACAGSKSGHLEAVKLLLESNADVHALNKWRETPLLTAANHGQAGAVEQLLRAGADPCKCTDTGWSPLSIAAYKGHDEVVKLLLEEGAPTEEADPTLSALLQAATKGLPDTVELLLRHGADHTVTTKKGDTALSILVEQNLIDAAVEMVTEYKASIPRCSRDRKKVQRARLLINLRVKQQQRESGSGDDDGDSTMASGNQTNNSNSRKKKKKKKNSAELEAKAAEEALLLELEQEDADRHKQEQDASKKSAKKRKKKDRERQLKKEQEDKLIAEEMKKEEKRRKEEEAKDAAEREERQRLVMARKKEEDETRRKQEKSIRQQQQKEQQMHRKKLRKEEEERKKLLQQKESAEKVNNGNGKNGQRSVVQSVEGQKQTPQSSSTNQTNAVVAKNGVPKKGNSTKSGGNKRGWESIPAAKKSVSETSNTTSTTNGSKQQAVTSSKPDTANDKTALDQESYASSRNSNESIVGTESTVTATVNQHQKHANSMDSSSTTTVSSGDYAISISSQNQNVAPNPIHIAAVRIEPPAVSVFRHGKVSELLNRCSAAKATTDPLGSVDSIVVKKVLFRWIMRAAHECSAYVDFIIPSWNDLNKLSTFFQRQFISETRKLVPNTGNSIRMETLKEAGTVLAHLCHSFAKDVAEFHRRVVDQLPPDWNDAIIGVSVSGVPSNLESSTVVINWANQSQVTMSTSVFMRLKERFKGATPQFLSSIFVCKTCYDTKLLLIENTSMDYSLTSNTRSNISSELSVSAEAWSDPFSALSSNSFWGQFAEIDRMFGGLEPFGACDINDDLLCKHGGSISVLAPPDNMLASRYLNRMVDILDSCEQTNLPVSFAVFIRSECLVNQKSPPCTDDLYTLEPRLRNRVNYMSRVETLDEGRHYYFSEKLGGPNASTTTSLFVLLQNSSGKDRFRLRNVGMLEIMNSTKTEIKRVDEPRLVDSAPTTYAPEMTQRNDDNAYISHSAHFIQPQPSTNLPASPVPPHSTLTTDFDFGSTFPSSFGQDSSSGVRTSRAGTRRGRLFDLVDNGEEDNTMNDVDVVSGMLGTLNVDLFQNSGAQDVDIEAISLMGIGDPSHAPTAFHPRSNKTQGRFG